MDSGVLAQALIVNATAENEVMIVTGDALHMSSVTVAVLAVS
jgi:hypothetical protein